MIRYEDAGIEVHFPERDEKKFFVVSHLAGWLKKNRIDILHTHSYKPNIYGRLAGLLTQKVKIIAHYHNYYDAKWEKDKSILYDQLLANFSERLIACSQSVRENTASAMGLSLEKIDVILNGVDLGRFEGPHDSERVRSEWGVTEGYKVVGMIGRICEQKAQEDFIRAAEKIRMVEDKTVFVIVGQADDPERLNRMKALAKELGIDDLIFDGYRTDIPAVFSALDLFVLPSLWEGLPLILVEAMASGKPIVSTDIGPAKEVVTEDTALLVPPKSPEKLASQVVSLLQDWGRAEEMGRMGRKRATQFSWRQSGMQMDALYQAVLKAAT